MREAPASPVRADPVAPAADGIAIGVRLTPRARRDEVTGLTTLADGRELIAARVRAVPEKGAANAALEALIARWLGVPAGRVRVARGAKDRVKTVRVEGAPGELAARARALIAGQACR